MRKLILSLDGTVLKEFALVKECTSIGRRPHNDIQIDNLAISGEHAQIVSVLDDAFLEDLDSTNGTAVNGQQIKKHVLADGDVIGLGRYRLKYFAASAEMADGKGLLHQEMARKIAADIDAGKAEPGAAAAAPEQAQAELRVQNGASAGKSLLLDKPTTRVGTAGIQVVAIERRRGAYFIRCVEGDPSPLVNGLALGTAAVALRDQDVIELSGIRMAFVLKA